MYPGATNFYPRSPCGERPVGDGARERSQGISIHALLAESDSLRLELVRRLYHFYPRSPCGERPLSFASCFTALLFLSTLSLRRATAVADFGKRNVRISIHALLAESDDSQGTLYQFSRYISIHALLAESDWGPRWIECRHPLFLSTLSLRRATPADLQIRAALNISIHALLAESDPRIALMVGKPPAFLSTLSLRRATVKSFMRNGFFLISIHALLAESDSAPARKRAGCHHFYPRSPCGERLIPNSGTFRSTHNFYPRSPCGERRKPRALKSRRMVFLSTLSLRRATCTSIGRP